MQIGFRNWHDALDRVTRLRGDQAFDTVRYLVLDCQCAVSEEHCKVAARNRALRVLHFLREELG
jgi:hypothetical protein